MMQIVGLVFGLISGIVWEALSTSPYKQYKTLLPSLFVNNQNRMIHVHHWLFYGGLLLLTFIWSVKTQRLFHPAVLMILFYLLGAISYNFYKYNDWYIFLK